MSLSRVTCSKCGELGDPIELPDNDRPRAKAALEEAGWHVQGAAAVCPDCMGIMSAAVALPNS